MSEEDKTSASFTTPLGKFQLNGKKTAEIIMVFSLTVTGILAYAFWQHEVQSAERQTRTESRMDRQEQRTQESIERMTTAIKAQAREQKFQTCILSLPVSERAAEYNNPNSLCARLAR